MVEMNRGNNTHDLNLYIPTQFLSEGHTRTKSLLLKIFYYLNSGQYPLLASIISSNIALATLILGTVLFKVNACSAFS